MTKRDNNMTIQFQAPLKEKEAQDYIDKYGYHCGRVLVGTAKSIAARFCVMMTETEVDTLQQVICDENHHLAYKLLEKMYDGLDEPVPMYLRAYAGSTECFGLFLDCLSIELQACEIYLEAYKEWLDDKEHPTVRIMIVQERE